MAKKQQMKKYGSLAFQWLKIRRRRTGRGHHNNPINRRNRNRNHPNPNPNPPNNAEPGIDLNELSTNPNSPINPNPNTNTHPANDLNDVSNNPNNNPSPTNDLTEVYRAATELPIERRMESSLKRCSAVSNDKKDIAFNQTENASNDKLNPTPVSAARHMESSLERCSALSNKDTAFNQTKNTSNEKLNPTPVSADHRKMGSDKDTGFSQLETTVRAKSFVGLSRTHVFGCVTPYSRALASRVGQRGVLRLPLSVKAANLVKGGMSVGLAVRTVGLQNAFTSWRDGASIYVSLRAKNGGLAVTKA